MPFLLEPVDAPSTSAQPAVRAAITLSGIDPAAADELGGLRLVGGGQADLSALGRAGCTSHRAAPPTKLDARSATRSALRRAAIRPTASRVIGIVKDELARQRRSRSTTTGIRRRRDAAARASKALTGHTGQVNFLTVALKGERERPATGASDAAISRLEPFLQSAEGARCWAATGLSRSTTSSRTP